MKSAAIAGLLCLVVAACTGSPGRSASRTASSGPAGASPAVASPAVSGPASSGPASSTSASAVSTVPHFAHVVVVIEENHANSQIIGNAQAPYMNALGRSGVELTDSFGVTHPSEPNYLALFSGSTQGVTDDSCPHTFGGSNLGYQLRSRGLSFAGYSQSLPTTGYSGCTAGPYARKHAPWTNFQDLPASVSQPMTAFPSDYSKLPQVSFVVPNLNDDMHDGTVQEADSWLRSQLSGYVTWARSHNSLLVLTWDEDDDTSRNQIPGVLAGAHVTAGARYAGRVDHYTVLRSLETAFGLSALGTAAHRAPITGIWVP
jgi:hypothetical protein